MDQLSKLASIIAMCIGGAWVLYNFHIQDSAATNPELKIETEVFPYSDDTRLVIIHLKPHNIGKVPIEIEGDGLSLRITKYPKNAKVGLLNTESLKPDFLIKKIEQKYGAYVLEPGVEFDEVVSYVLPVGDTYLLESSMDLGDDWEVEGYHTLKVD